MKPLTIITLGIVISSRILTEFFSFLSPLGNPSYLLLGMFSIYLSTKSKTGMFSILFIYDMLILLRNIGFLETSYNSYIEGIEIIKVGAVMSSYTQFILSIIFILITNGTISFIIGYNIGKKHIIGL